MFPHPWVPLHSLQSVGGENGGKKKYEYVSPLGQTSGQKYLYHGVACGDRFAGRMRWAERFQHHRRCRMQADI